MENSDNNFDAIIQQTQEELEAMDFIAAVQDPTPLQVTGVEDLSVGESFGLFFKEFSTAIDRKLVSMTKAVHPVDADKLRKIVANRNILFVKNSGVGITVPANYTPGIANMMMHTKGTLEGVFLISSLKTEAVRLYDWLKQLIKLGRPETTFRWSVSNFDTAIDSGERFVKGLPDTNRRQRVPLGQVYVNFEEMLDVIDTYNAGVKSHGARDAEMASKELAQVYELTQLLIAKIKANELTFDKSVITNLEITFNRFVDLTNLCGAMMTLLNELSAVLREQVGEVSRL